MCDCVVLCAEDPKDRRRGNRRSQIESKSQIKRDIKTALEELIHAEIESDVKKIVGHKYKFVNKSNFSNYKEFYDFMLENSPAESTLGKKRKHLIELLRKDRDSNK